MFKNIIFITLFFITSIASAIEADWTKIEQKAKGQVVYFYAWGGSPDINNYLRWAGKKLFHDYGVTLKHVKVTDISQSISSLLAAKTANKDTNGSIDLVWINGENFKMMKQFKLLSEPFVKQLPSFKYLDKSLPIDNDFSEPTLDLEAPWGVGQLVFIYDQKRLKNPPKSYMEMLSYAKANPNRLSYPRPPSFHGTSFLKSALLELALDPTLLYKPVDPETFLEVSAPLWSYLDDFHKVAWNKGKLFPANNAQMISLLDDGQLDLAITFNPNEVFAAQKKGLLSYNTKAYSLKAGALTNIHFLAIPWNASATEGALVTINFLLSPKAQSRKSDLSVWGDPSVLEQKYLSSSAQSQKLFKPIPEPDPSWQIALEKEWQKRYGH